MTVSGCPEKPELASPWATGVARDREDEKTVPTEAIGSILAGEQKAKMKIAVDKIDAFIDGNSG